MQRQLKLRLCVESSWSELEREEWLARFVRTLEAGRRRTPRWRLRSLDEGRVGWEARLDRFDRTQRLTLSAPGADPPAAEEWTLSVESGPPERAPVALRGGEWLVGTALALAAYLVARPHLGRAPSLMAALALLFLCGSVLPRLAWRAAPPELGDEPDDVDGELLERVRRGAAAFAGFRLLTRDWEEP